MSFNKKAFTLIEVLLVIAILAIIASTISYGMIQHQKKARDARRKSDLEKVKIALEQAKLDCKFPYYPYLGLPASVDSSYNGVYKSAIQYLVNGKYIPAPIWGPNGVESSVDRYSMVIFGIYDASCPDQPEVPGVQDTTGTPKFALAARLENLNDPSLKTSFQECESTGYTIPLGELQQFYPFKDDNNDDIDDNGFYYVCSD